MKDLFIDNDAATSFLNPIEAHYKKLFRWLINEGYLVVSKKLLVEYTRTSGACLAAANICVIVNHLTTTGRLVCFEKSVLDAFIIPKRTEKRLTCNYEDRVHLKTVLLSNRKYALSKDARLRNDINTYPGYQTLAADCPEKIPYMD